MFAVIERSSTLHLRLIGLALILLSAVPASADTRLTYERIKERTGSNGETIDQQEKQSEIWIGENAVLVSDGDGESRLYVEGSGRLVLLRHAERTWEELPEGTTIRDIAPEVFRPHLEKAIRDAATEVEIEPTEVTKRIGEWSCRRHVLRIMARGQVTHGEVWAAPSVSVEDDALYRRAQQLWFGLEPTRAVDLALDTLDGLRVETRISAERRDGSEVVAMERLLHIEDHPDDPSRFEIPEGYRQVPLDTTRWMKMARPAAR